MTEGKKIIECVPNFSEGRDEAVIEGIVAPLKNRPGVRLVNYEADRDYNRLVVTVLGDPEPVCQAILDAVGEATRLIDLNHHEGEHLRMGATDVVLKNPKQSIIELKNRKETVFSAKRFSVPLKTGNVTAENIKESDTKA